MIVVLTGSTGLLGSHILHQGLELGHSFKLLVREIPRRAYLNEILNHQQVEIIKVDFQDMVNNPLNYVTIFSGAELFINSMGLASSSHELATVMNEVNFIFPQALFKMANTLNIKKMVNISSVATMSSAKDDQVVTEENLGNFRKGPYAESKYKLDKWIDDEFPGSILSIHPCYMLGKWDARPSSGSIFLGLKLKKLKHFINNYKNFIAAKDVAKTLWNGVNKDEKGHFLVGGINTPIESFIKIAAEKLKISTDEFHFYKMSEWDTLSKRLDLQTVHQVEELCLSNAVDDSKARKKLDHKPTESIDEIIDESLQYFVEKKLIRI